MAAAAILFFVDQLQARCCCAKYCRIYLIKTNKFNCQPAARLLYSVYMHSQIRVLILIHTHSVHHKLTFLQDKLAGKQHV